MEEISYEYLRSLGPLCQKDIDGMLRLRITSLTQCFEQPLAGEMDHPKNSSLYPRGDHRLPFDFAPLVLSEWGLLERGRGARSRTANGDHLSDRASYSWDDPFPRPTVARSIESGK